jgi:succinate dehydrogenase/fumarate reductase cytochrome b subunit
MTLNILKTLSGVLIIVFFFSKVIVHYYLDYKHNRSISFLYSLTSPLQYLQPYKAKVEAGFEKLQRLCNLLLALALIALLVNVILGVAIYSYKK